MNSILLENVSMDLDESIVKYLKQYERYINLDNAFKLPESTQRVSLIERLDGKPCDIINLTQDDENITRVQSEVSLNLIFESSIKLPKYINFTVNVGSIFSW